MADVKEIQISEQDGLIVATLQCENLDEAHAQNMHERVVAAGAKQPTMPVVLDMAQVGFVPSLSLGALITLLKALKGQQQRLMLVGLQSPVRETLTICRLTKLFEIYDDVAGARAQLDTPA